MSRTQTFVVKVRVLPVIIRMIAVGWLIVGVVAAVNTESSDRELLAAIGIASGMFILLAGRPVRVVFDHRKRTVSVQRRLLIPWTTRISESAFSDIVEARIIVHDQFEEPWRRSRSRGRWSLLLLRQAGAPVFVLERTDVALESSCDKINELLKSFGR